MGLGPLITASVIQLSQKMTKEKRWQRMTFHDVLSGTMIDMRKYAYQKKINFVNVVGVDQL